MDFANERYVRLYTRDTVTWKRLTWDGQNMLQHLLRRADRAGVIDIGELPPWEAAVVLCGAPEEQAQRGVAKCLELGCIVHDGDRLVFPRYIEANETPMSDKLRAQESRAKRAALSRSVTAASQNVTERHAASHAVTPRHAPSHAVTPCRTVPSVPNHADHASAEGGSGGDDESHVRSAAAAGRVWWMEVFGRDDWPHTGRWEKAYESIASKPIGEKANVARTIAGELGKPGARRKMTPNHINDYWVAYEEGQPPGGWKKGSDVGPMLGASEIAAAKAEFTTLEQKYRDSQGEAKKAALAAWTEADTKLKEIKKRYA